MRKFNSTMLKNDIVKFRTTSGKTLSIADLGNEIGISYTSMYGITVLGNTPSIDMLCKICEVIKRNPGNYFFTDKTNENDSKK